MKFAKKTCIAILIILCLLSLTCSPAFAQRALRKLGRGVTNAALGWTEILTCIELTGKESGPMAGASYGLLKGLVNSALRTVVGLYETVTFIAPAPEEYKVILEPEFPMQKEMLKLAD